MTIRAYIIDFIEPAEVADAYEYYFSHGGFLLSTSDDLELSQQIKIRFNFPDGNGTTILARVVSELPGRGFGLQLPEGSDLQWLLAKSKPYSDELKRRRRAKPKQRETRPLRAPEPDEIVTRPLGPDEARGLVPPMPRAQGGAETKPIATQGGGRQPVQPVPRDGPSTEDEIPPSRDMAEELAPSEQELMRRIAHLDRVVAQKAGEVPPGATIQAAPLPSGEEGLPDEEEAQPAVEAPREETKEERLRALPSNQKKKLAISGGRAEREILMQDPDHGLQIWVFKNPSLEEEEVVGYAKMETLSSEALSFLLHSRTWGTCIEVALSLALNPRTPPEAIPNLLTVLPSDILKTLVSTKGLRHLVTRQARRLLMERSAH